MPRTLKRYGPVSTRQRAAGFEIMEDGDFYARKDVIGMLRRRRRTELDRIRANPTGSTAYNQGHVRADVLDDLLARLGVKP